MSERDLIRIQAGSTTVERRREAARIIDDALTDYGGPCSQAYADVLTAWVHCPAGAREALFLELAYRAVGLSPTSQSPCPGSRSTSAPAPDQATDLSRAQARNYDDLRRDLAGLADACLRVLRALRQAREG